ncbi:MAG: TonB family protein [Candidatus Omnitrophica bacterium]|nr:TonB family protein [Candidatus Omnitrophota bacterium]
MMESNNRILLRIFIVCLLGHLIILPLFSLVLPEKIKKPHYQIVYLYQEPKSPIADIVAKRITPELPLTSIREKQRIDIPLNESGRREKDIAIGIQRTPLLTVENLENIELTLPQPRITITSLNQTPVAPEKEPQHYGTVLGESFEISGPGGARPIISKFIPDYPLWAEKQGIEANIKIKIWINKEGFVSSTEIAETSGYRKLDLLAEQAIKKWRFASIDKDIDVWAIVTFKFRLK